ncbi:SHOCT domain-containing protein [Pelagicoccus sp. SDUM812003]|uniref:SHOCT domain-containing protein n=1 Tax=Pelagicoccus sp. SDUM812003 TaxID=3041267 RepID=UPI002810650A|nr:SHOCT domain-containing protein [Pelagicoccus sp. SDUM812003]MDQ8201743.1 SHOCT domain-containing protein [Pelagicoccus sp. SDUM812003]
MQNLTEFGRNAINEIAQRYGLSNDAVTHMLIAVSNGGGTMAQFNCPELGGGGQWMQGGMTMVGDMFNNGLRNTVDNLCGELSNLLYNQGSSVFAPVKRQAQSSHHSSQQQSQGNSPFGQNSLYISGSNFGNWWPDELNLGAPSSTGGQNNIRYAVFPQSNRLAIEVNGQVTVYDTLDHQIGGVSQQQSGDASMSFSSQYGTVFISQLPVVYGKGSSTPARQPAPEQPEATPQPNASGSPQSPAPAPKTESSLEEDIFEKIERLASLHEKGALTDEEFSSKKSELLQRL